MGFSHNLASFSFFFFFFGLISKARSLWRSQSTSVPEADVMDSAALIFFNSLLPFSFHVFFLRRGPIDAGLISFRLRLFLFLNREDSLQIPRITQVYEIFD